MNFDHNQYPFNISKEKDDTKIDLDQKIRDQKSKKNKKDKKDKKKKDKKKKRSSSSSSSS